MRRGSSSGSADGRQGVRRSDMSGNRGRVKVRGLRLKRPWLPFFTWRPWPRPIARTVEAGVSAILATNWSPGQPRRARESRKCAARKPPYSGRYPYPRGRLCRAPFACLRACFSAASSSRSAAAGAHGAACGAKTGERAPARTRSIRRVRPHRQGAALSCTSSPGCCRSWGTDQTIF